MSIETRDIHIESQKKNNDSNLRVDIAGTLRDARRNLQCVDSQGNDAIFVIDNKIIVYGYDPNNTERKKYIDSQIETIKKTNPNAALIPSKNITNEDFIKTLYQFCTGNYPTEEDVIYKKLLELSTRPTNIDLNSPLFNMEQARKIGIKKIMEVFGCFNQGQFAPIEETLLLRGALIVNIENTTQNLMSFVTGSMTMRIKKTENNNIVFEGEKTVTGLMLSTPNGIKIMTVNTLQGKGLQEVSGAATDISPIPIMTMKVRSDMLSCSLPTNTKKINFSYLPFGLNQIAESIGGTPLRNKITGKSISNGTLEVEEYLSDKIKTLIAEKIKPSGFIERIRDFLYGEYKQKEKIKEQLRAHLMEFQGGDLYTKITVYNKLIAVMTQKKEEIAMPKKDKESEKLVRSLTTVTTAFEAKNKEKKMKEIVKSEHLPLTADEGRADNHAEHPTSNTPTQRPRSSSKR